MPRTVACAFQKVGSAATKTYANQCFTKQAATSTAYIFAGGDLVATNEGNGSATSTRYIHADHLASLTAASDEHGGIAQIVDYYPYGSERLSESYDGPEVDRTAARTRNASHAKLPTEDERAVV